MFVRCILLNLSIALLLTSPAAAIDVFFVPDTVSGQVNQTVTLSVQISPTDLMRSFTIYMAYDTNRFDLYEPPTPGPVIAGHAGLQFNYFDHAPFLPNVLEVTATIFGSDFWQGPGEIFQVRFILRSCGDEPLVAPYPPFFIAADDSYPPGNFHPALVRICNVVPRPAQSLTISRFDPLSVILRWLPVTQDTSGLPLPSAPSYLVSRQQILPSVQPPVFIATVPDTFYTDPYDAGVEYLYQIITQTSP